MEKIIRAYCPQCSDYNDCPYRLRSLESKCIKLDDIACGYELAEKDLALTPEDVVAIVSLYKQGIGEGDAVEDIIRKFNEQRKK